MPNGGKKCVGLRDVDYVNGLTSQSPYMFGLWTYIGFSNVKFYSGILYWHIIMFVGPTIQFFYDIYLLWYSKTNASSRTAGARQLSTTNPGISNPNSSANFNSTLASGQATRQLNKNSKMIWFKNTFYHCMFWSVYGLNAILVGHWWRKSQFQLNRSKDFWTGFWIYSPVVPYYFPLANLAILLSIQYATYNEEKFHSSRQLLILHRYFNYGQAKNSSTPGDPGYEIDQDLEIFKSSAEMTVQGVSQQPVQGLGGNTNSLNGAGMTGQGGSMMNGQSGFSMAQSANTSLHPQFNITTPQQSQIENHIKSEFCVDQNKQDLVIINTVNPMFPLVTQLVRRFPTLTKRIQILRVEMIRRDNLPGGSKFYGLLRQDSDLNILLAKKNTTYTGKAPDLLEQWSSWVPDHNHMTDLAT